MTLDEMRQYIQDELAKFEEMDGFDMAFFQGIEAVLEQCGDGGLSEQWIDGVKFALDNLSLDAICGEWDEP